MKDLTFFNDRGDKLTVKCGGIGGDNVVGTVEEKQSGGAFSGVNQAAVKIRNITDDYTTNTTTGRQGDFDVDVDADCNDKILVEAEWTDAAGRAHIITVRFRCTCDKGKKPRRGEIRDLTPDERLKEIERREAALPVHLESAAFASEAALAAQWETLVLIAADLSALAKENRAVQQEAIDKRIVAEIVALFYKLEQYGPKPPPPDQQWAIMLELIALMLKLVAKSWWLQEQQLPEFPKPRWRGDTV